MKLFAVTAAMMLCATSTFAADLPPELEQTLRARLERNLADPYSAQIKLMKEPWADTARLADRDYSGKFVCASINAKNGYGAYVGFQTYLFVVEDDGNILVLPALSRIPESAALAEAKCRPG